jgi:hypothetical protein
MSQSESPSPDLINVFDAAWKVIGRQGSLSASEQSRLRLNLAMHIVTLSNSGINDPREMRRLAIEHFLLAPE